MPDGRCVPLFRDRGSGFHWMPERLHALPTIKGHRAVVSKCLEQSNQAGIDLEYVPVLNCAKQRTRFWLKPESKTEIKSEEKYESIQEEDT